MYMDLSLAVEDERYVSIAPATTSIVVFTAIDGILRHPATGVCSEARDGLEMLASRGVPVVLMSHGEPGPVQDLQEELGFRQPFICERGAALYIPRGYFEELDGLTSGDSAWEIFDFGVPEPARAVRLLTSLFSVRGEDVLTIGFGCDWDDRMLLDAVNVPIVVRQEETDQARLFRRFPAAYVTAAAGPAGWSEAVLGSAV